MSHQDIDNMTIAQLKLFAPSFPGGETFLSHLFCSSYSSFIKSLYKDIDIIISKLEDSRHLMQDDSEDRISIDIVNSLSCMGYEATHDTQTGGHCDIYVKSKTYRWIGEAKIYKGNSYINEGFLQLSTRYTTGSKDQNEGALLIYIKKRNASSIMHNWKEEFQKLNSDIEISFENDEEKPIGFFSTHNHKSSGTPYRTRHIPVLLHFEPEDKSARASIKKKIDAQS